MARGNTPQPDGGAGPNEAGAAPDGGAPDGGAGPNEAGAAPDGGAPDGGAGPNEPGAAPDGEAARQRDILAQFQDAIAGMRTREIQIGLRELLARSRRSPGC